MEREPVVDLVSGEVVYEEYLCRPEGMTVAQYFDVASDTELWERERRCIEKALDIKTDIPKLINLTVDSLPFFLKSSYAWQGGLEIVEWQGDREKLVPYLPLIGQRGLEVWIDDLAHEELAFWREKDVTGFKIWPENLTVAVSGKRVIVEGVETEQQLDRVKKAGIQLAQGYLFSRKETMIYA
jgi:hypothetical protein